MGFNKKYLNLSTYLVVFFTYGVLLTAYGPIMIYFSKYTKRDQTYYSFIYLFKTLGYVSGGFLIKYIKKYEPHTILKALLCVIGLSMLMTSLSLEFLNLSIWVFVISNCCCCINIIIITCLVKMFKDNQPDYWLQLISLSLAIGGCVCPIIINQFEHNSFIAIGVIFLCNIIPFLFLQPVGSVSDQVQDQNSPKISTSSQIYICILFLFYMGYQIGFSSWIPTYALKSGIADQHGSVYLSSIFWTSITVSKIIFLYLPGSISKRLYFCLIGYVLTSLVSLILQSIEYIQAAAYVSSLFYGFFSSSIFSLLCVIATEYKFKVTATNNTHFIMAASISEALLAMPIGYGMQIFGQKLLIIMSSLFSFIMFLVYRSLTNNLEIESLALLKKK